jgi:hypothetical protein
VGAARGDAWIAAAAAVPPCAAAVRRRRVERLRSAFLCTLIFIILY